MDELPPEVEAAECDKEYAAHRYAAVEGDAAELSEQKSATATADARHESSQAKP